ncbi:MAG TPA: NAD(P)H-dependent oxidoreductase subunit E [Steroidobacteraceae bacterium]|jgi:NADH-quinone oxidoreductase subunit E|nr:NAD(P)H-dependent oxidoreductase subunit E [Steroidobacteraceae bacterium]HVY79513.1 NAD(P)H-dependent oxidoreductase subunit E [Steroidobacteraceae bacterium]
MSTDKLAPVSKVKLLSEHTRREIDHWVAKFPPGRQRSACISALRAAQEQNNGYLTQDLLEAVAEYLRLPPVQVYEVASFYSMFELHPCGRHHVSVCTNISCMLCGADEIVAYVEKKLGIKTGESTPDGRIFLKREEECLAACTGAPMMMVDHVFYENLTPEKIDKVLDELK